MCNDSVFLSQVLGDIEIAQGLQRDTEKKEREVRTHMLHVSAHPYLPPPSPPPPRMVLGRCPTHWMSTMNF